MTCEQMLVRWALLDVMGEHVNSHFDVVLDEAHFGHVGDAAFSTSRNAR